MDLDFFKSAKIQLLEVRKHVGSAKNQLKKLKKGKITLKYNFKKFLSKIFILKLL
jgi:hypothetical protein